MRRRGIDIVLFTAAWMALAGCGDPSAAPSTGELGSLIMPLAAEVNGIHYRLTGTFFLTGAGQDGFLRENGSGTILVATLPPGDYQVELLDGWSLERQSSLEDGATHLVAAELVSPNPRQFTMFAGSSVTMAWVFATDGQQVAFPPGLYQGNLAVIDSSNPATDIPGSVALGEQAHADALGSIERIHGDLVIRGPVTSLTSLAQLAAVEGDLDISFSSLTDLEGLENLSELGGSVRIVSNDSLADSRGLAALREVTDLYVFRNPSLPTCEAERLRDQLVIGASGPDGSFETGEIVIFDNGEGSCSPE